MRLALAGASGSGKTYSSLLIAYGMTGDWSKIAVIDSENCSADLYAHLGGYQVLTLENYAPETYIEAIFSLQEACSRKKEQALCLSVFRGCPKRRNIRSLPNF